MLQRFAPVDLGVDLDELSPSDRGVLECAVRAARCVDTIFWKQSWSGALALRERLSASIDPADQLRLEQVAIMAGPYDRLDEFRPFLAEVPPRPLGAGFYPEDMSRAEFEAWLRSHPEDRLAFESLYTRIQRHGRGLVAVPYREAYREELEEAAHWLDSAAGHCRQPSFGRFLSGRARALLTDDYFQSDLDSTAVGDNRIDVTIGPYETVEDVLFGYKASFAAYVGVVDVEESDSLQTVARYLDDMDRVLGSGSAYPVYRGAQSPIRVVNLVFSAGQARVGVQTTAFNLPNDGRVQEIRGSRKVMLRNVARAKFDLSMRLLADRLLEPADASRVSFEAYFRNVLLHEMAHSLGPSFLTRAGGGGDGGRTTMRKCLRDLYAPVEEAKADVVGLLFHQWLMDRQILLPQAPEVYCSFLAGLFRALRFGIEEVHGKAGLLELNFLLEHGSVRYDRARGRFAVDLRRIPADIEELAHRLVGLEARGCYDEARQWMERYGHPSDELVALLARLKEIPVDIRPRYLIEAHLAGAG